MKQIRYIIEALLLYTLFWGFKILPAEMASNIGGTIGRTIGPHLATSRKALRNIQRALPNLSPEEHHNAITEMWENLGRIMAEYPHLETIATNHTHIENKKYLTDLSKENKNFIAFGAHMGNWEVFSATLLKQMEKSVDVTYRAPNNPWSNKLLIKVRTLNGKIKAYPKSRIGGRNILEAIKKNRNIGILIDQKYNEGLNVPFFGMPAMTNPAFVQLAQKYNLSLIPVRSERINGINFKISFYEPLILFDENKNPLPVEHVIKNAHRHLEEWITASPGQWLWLHRRWNFTEPN